MELPGGVYSYYAHSDKWEFDLERGLRRPFCCSEYFFAGLPHLSGVEYNDISSLKKEEFESVEKENEDVLKTKISSLTKELESKRKELEDVVEKNASSCLQKDAEFRALTKELEDVVEKNASSCLQKDEKIRALTTELQGVQEKYNELRDTWLWF